MKHSQGIWKLGYDQADNMPQIDVLEVDGSGDSHPIVTLLGDNAENNARFLLAAPDMLATLRAIANDCEQYLNDDLELSPGDLCQAFLNAINEVHDKATGSTFASDEPVDEYGEEVTP